MVSTQARALSPLKPAMPRKARKHASQSIPCACAQFTRACRLYGDGIRRKRTRRTESRPGHGPVYSRRDDVIASCGLRLLPGNKPRAPPVSPASIRSHSAGETVMSQAQKSDADRGVNRRKVLECMTWAGTGVLWTIAGGVPRSLGIIDGALAAEPSTLTFLQISDSHVGFDKPANPNVIGTLEQAIGKIKSLPAKPAFLIHTGDITHLSKPAEF